ncbi:MAG: hypothetical protein HC909_02940 [Blastochloris sp.]|nr:hypothetical protein [Blastochloris sp.]
MIFSDREFQRRSGSRALPRAELNKYINRKSKLNWLNNRYLRDLPVETLWPLVAEFCRRDPQIARIVDESPDRLRQSFESVKVYLDTLDELPAYVRELFHHDVRIDDVAAHSGKDQLIV